MTKRRVVITGIGPVTPIGIGKEAFWNNLVAGKSGIDHITQFDTEGFNVKIAGEVKDFDYTALFYLIEVLCIEVFSDFVV